MDSADVRSWLQNNQKSEKQLGELLQRSVCQLSGEEDEFIHNWARYSVEVIEKLEKENVSLQRENDSLEFSLSTYTQQ